MTKQTFNGRELTELPTVRGVEWVGRNPLGLIELRRTTFYPNRGRSGAQVFECRLEGAPIGRAFRPGEALRRGERWLAKLLQKALSQRKR